MMGTGSSHRISAVPAGVTHRVAPTRRRGWPRTYARGRTSSASSGPGSPHTGLADLASRSGACREHLERLAWAGALDGLLVAGVGPGPHQGGREASWRSALAGVGSGGGPDDERQLPLPLEPPSAPTLPAMGRWEQMLEDYRSTGLSATEHPMALLRDGLGQSVLRSSELAGRGDGRGRGGGDLPAATRDRQGHHLRDARRRGGGDQPDRRHRPL